MAGSFADFLEKKVLDQIFGATAYTAPATLYAGLSTTTPGDDATNFTEPSGNAYARVAITNNTTNFPNATGSGAGGSTKQNGTAVTFPTATGSWGTVTYMGFFDAASVGNLLAYGQLAVAKLVQNLDTPSFAINDVTITLD